MPSFFAYWFISTANVASLPPTASASAIDASLPDCTIMPFSSTSTGTELPIARYVVEPSEPAPPVRQAYSLISAGSSSDRRFSAIALNTP
jgi:hypothetical protein